ncbi:cell division protein FtsQ/DivIB [Arcanobacterium hippocoleae]|uniref:Cell division septal protein FtsQ n=1 Tax=Arcanobacterium hippocoleae TaxID=149017 RepID=A0ABU1T2A4_9ACTO|nr:hypothetical protein [Arcanobacterium hippocoleae]MDR6939000.1 cell division septal protein FtsQ [Arcanobacterium hippocoleae]
MRVPKQPRKRFSESSKQLPDTSVTGNFAQPAEFEVSMAGGEIASAAPTSTMPDSVPTAPLVNLAQEAEYSDVVVRSNARQDRSDTDLDPDDLNLAQVPLTAAENKSAVAEDAKAQRLKALVRTVQDLRQNLYTKFPIRRKSAVRKKVRGQKNRMGRKYFAQAQSAVSLDARIAEKKHERRRVRYRRIGISFGALGIILVALWILLFAPFARFDPESVEVQGATPPSTIDPAQVAKILQNYTGEPLLFLRKSGITQELQQIPEVGSVNFEISFGAPVRINLEMAKPVFCVPQGDSCQAVNATGQKMRVSANDLTNIPRLGPVPENKDQAQVVQAALELLNVIAPDLRALIARVDYSPAGQFSFHLTDNRTVNWGISEFNDVKAKILRSLLTEPGKTSFDVSLPEAPVAK